MSIIRRMKTESLFKRMGKVITMLSTYLLRQIIQKFEYKIERNEFLWQNLTS